MSVRRALGRDETGRLTFGDVVGDLVCLDDERAVIEGRDGPVEVSVATVAIAKLVPASTADELALEAVAARSSRPAETEQLSGWLLRADPAQGLRANSILPLRQLDRPLDEALEAARAWYAARGLPLVIAAPTESRRLLDAELGERGWDFSPDIHVMIARLDRLPATAPTRATVQDEPPDDAWLQLWLRENEPSTTAGPSAMRGLLVRHDTVGFASIRAQGALDEQIRTGQTGEMQAVGRGTVDDCWLGIGLAVAAAWRRQGLARDIFAALHAWGRERGAIRAYVDVPDNAAAISLCEQLGYYRHHDYRYRTEPAVG